MQTDRITMVPIDQLTAHPLIERVYGLPDSDADFPDLVESIRTYGVLEPLIITPDQVIISGLRRVTAAIQAGLSQVPTRTMTGLDDTAQQDLILTLNQHRKRLISTMVREAIAIEDLAKEINNNSVVHNGNHSNRSKSYLESSRLAKRVGFKDKRLFEQAKSIVLSGDSGLISLMDDKTIATAYRKFHRQQNGISSYSSIIKPSDNWNFSPIKYERLNGSVQDGYIPGDIYANCFWYFVRPNDLVIDLMAGSGMARHIYNQRHEWMGAHIYDFRLRLFDLTPQSEEIEEHNILNGLPVDDPDYIFLDLPYLGMSKYAYSRKKEDLANMDENSYLQSVMNLAKVCALGQKPGKLCTVISPNYTDHQSRRIINMTEHIRESWRSVGYKLYMETYASRRIQQRQHPTMAKINNMAKERRLPLTDIVLIMTFERCT